MLVLCCFMARTGCVLAEEPRVEPRTGGRLPSNRAPSPETLHVVTKSETHFDAATLPILHSQFDARFDANFNTALPSVAGTNGWGTEFRPRGEGLSSKRVPGADIDSAPNLHATNAWQRLEEFKARRGIRLLTLWENKFSTLSLQTGKSGNPSLQWTSRSFHSGDASQGLVDRLLAKGLEQVDRMEHREAGSPESSGVHPAEK
jgi:hypothetical protein